MSSSFPIFLAGASGLLAGEFLRLLEGHAHLHLHTAYTRLGGQPLAELHPHLACPPIALPPQAQIRTQDPSQECAQPRTSAAGKPQSTKALEHLGQDLAEALQLASAHTADRVVLLLALPHGKSAPWWAANREQLSPWASQLIVVDLSADFRLQDQVSYQKVYGLAHACPDELGSWAYGLPELHPLPKNCTRIAVPGCFATAMQLAVMPAVHAKLVDPNATWVLQGVTGSSGSGAHAKTTTHHPYRDGNFRAYALHGHRHEAELLAERNFQHAPSVDFTPHSGSFSRGIHLHAVLPMTDAITAAHILEQYQASFAQQPFVAVQSDAPEIRQVVGSNRALIGISTRGKNLHAICVLDNTLKGGAGQALQCLNLSLGLAQQTALPSSGMGY